MAENKTVPTAQSPRAFLDTVADLRKKADGYELLEMMEQITGEPGRMWGTSIVGFDTYRYRYASGREGDWMVTGFSLRKQNLTVYLMSGVERHRELLEQLGPHKTGKGCLYLKRLDDIDRGVLRRVIESSVEAVRRKDIRS
ncbi:DUF1801 domain-containing protein [Neolewinella litorea]|uniref:DUF1801 domain-containing protein n=1 Tax=Neolewinella litorea TaxID=2562452 RepID=A0A4S4NH88_9BACT|nr:DUF1801 domain-containing protein [Neolewinella litorea]THH37551.1 DUF1801 domain-containing protein [Neolewinella litorea]